MKIEVGKKYKHGWGDGSKDKTVKVVDIIEMSNGEIFIEYKVGGWLFYYKMTTELEMFKSCIDRPIIVKKHTEI